MYMDEFIKKFNFIFEKLKHKKSVGIWGIGRHTELLFQYTTISDLSITHIIDKNRFGSKFRNFIVESPDTIDWSTTDLDAVIIVSLRYQNEIYQTLTETLHYSGEIVTLYEKEDTDIFYLAQNKYMPLPSQLEFEHANLKDILSRLRYDMQYSQVDSFETRFQQNYSQYNKIKVYRLISERIGEVIGRFFKIFYDIQNDPNNYHLLLPDNRSLDFCNSSLFEIMGRKIEILNQDNYLFWNYIFDKHSERIDLSELDLYKFRTYKTYLNVRNNAYVEFTEKETETANRKIKEMGLEKEYVCLHVRDAEYLDNLNKQINLNMDDHWRESDYRDCNIHNYETAISYLSKQEFTTVRMGKFTTTPFSYPGCIDYASLYQEDLLDLYLIANCKFYIGTTSGLLEVAQLFGVPCAIINAIPILMGAEGLTFIQEDLMIPKKLWDKEKKRYLTFYEMFTMDMLCDFNHSEYVKHNIAPIENTPEEILDLVMEMNEKLNGTWQETEEMKELQEAYRSIRDTWLQEMNMPVEGIFPCQIGSRFLLKNKFLFEREGNN